MAERTNGTATDKAPLYTFALLQQRAELAQRLGVMFDGRRDLHSLLGYIPQLTYLDLKARYLRQHIAHRIVRVYPEATWAQPPTVREDNETETETPFEAAWIALEERLRVFSLLERTDVLANLGQYACLLIGLRGQPNLEQPIRPVRSIEDVIYLAPYSEEYVQVAELERRADLPTFGLPLYYTFTFGRGSTLASAGPTVPVLHGRVHASRVIHVVDDVLDDEVYGIPRLLPVFDLLDDIYKVEGGSAEQFYQDAKKRLVFSLRDEFQANQEDEAALAEEIEEFVHELRSFVRVQGMDVTAIPGNVASPKDHMGVIMALIASCLAVPKRLLEGSERGELSSRQDEAGFWQDVQRRQINVGERRLLRPLLDRLIAVRALPTPTTPYTIEWANVLSLSEEQQAVVVKNYATALNQAYAAGDFRSVIALSRRLVESLGFDPEDPLLQAPDDLLLLPEGAAAGNTQPDAGTPADGTDGADGAEEL
jgi:hypothetical protein